MQIWEPEELGAWTETTKSVTKMKRKPNALRESMRGTRVVWTLSASAEKMLGRTYHGYTAKVTDNFGAVKVRAIDV